MEDKRGSSPQQVKDVLKKQENHNPSKPCSFSLSVFAEASAGMMEAGSLQDRCRLHPASCCSYRSILHQVRIKSTHTVTDEGPSEALKAQQQVTRPLEHFDSSGMIKHVSKDHCFIRRSLHISNRTKCKQNMKSQRSVSEPISTQAQIKGFNSDLQLCLWSFDPRGAATKK